MFSSMLMSLPLSGYGSGGSNIDNKEELKLEEKKEKKEPVMLDVNFNLKLRGVEQISEDSTQIYLSNGDILIRPKIKEEELIQEEEESTQEEEEIKAEDVVFNQKSLIYSLFMSFIDLLDIKDKTKADQLRKKFPGLASVQASKKSFNEVEDDEDFKKDLGQIKEAFLKWHRKPQKLMSRYWQEYDIVFIMMNFMLRGECDLRGYEVVFIDQRKDWECTDVQECTNSRINGKYREEAKQRGAKQRGLRETFGIDENLESLISEAFINVDINLHYIGTWINFKEIVYVYRLPNNKGYVPYTRKTWGYLTSIQIQKLEDGNEYIDMDMDIGGKKIFTMQINRVKGKETGDPLFRNPIYGGLREDLPEKYSQEFVEDFFRKKCFPAWAFDETHFNYARVMVIAYDLNKKELFFCPYLDFIKSNNMHIDERVIAYVFRRAEWPNEVEALMRKREKLGEEMDLYLYGPMGSGYGAETPK